jgi:predicted transcriptional regulator of viral defense system
MRRTKKKNPADVAQDLFRKNHGVLKTKQVLDAGIHPRTLYNLRDSGVIEPIARGLFRLKEASPLESPDFFTIASKIPKGVICLVSALAFHELTTQIPREISIALTKGAEEPRIEYPPVKFYRISEPAFSEGIEIHKKDRVALRVYSREKTLADCFKFRRKIGMDVCIEALKEWRGRKGADTKKLMRFAKMCRVDRIIGPYIEALL